MVVIYISDCNVTYPEDIKPELACDNNQLVVRWPVNSTYNGNTPSVPASVSSGLLKKIAAAGKNILKLVVTTHTPP